MAVEELFDEELAALLDELETESSQMTAKTEPAKEVEAPKAPEVVAVDNGPDPAAAYDDIDEPDEAPVYEEEDDAPFEAPSEPEMEEPVEEEVYYSEPEPEPVEQERVVERAFSSDVPKTSEANGGLQYYIDVDKFRSDTRLTEATLDACMIEQNGLRAYYGAQAARAEAQHSRLKAKFDVIEATLYDYHRKELAASGEKTTEKMVENAVKIDPRWLKAKNTVIEAETIAGINKALVESLKDRRDMVIQLGADRRDEYKGAARVMADRESADNLERARAAAKVALKTA